MRGFRTGIDHLAATCPDMGRIVRDCGRPRSRQKEPGFPTLVRIIVDQQVSVHAGRAIWGRLEEALGAVTPAAVLRAGEGPLRAAGLSGSKTRYVLGIAQAIRSGEIDLDGLARRRDETVQRELMALKGIGRWTAEIYLMFALGRRDVWPAGDVALQAAAGHLLGYDERPDMALLDEIGERWRPYRSVAAVMLWHYYHRIPLLDARD